MKSIKFIISTLMTLIFHSSAIGQNVKMVADIAVDSLCSNPTNNISDNNKLYFFCNNSSELLGSWGNNDVIRELWEFDGKDTKRIDSLGQVCWQWKSYVCQEGYLTIFNEKLIYALHSQLIEFDKVNSKRKILIEQLEYGLDNFLIFNEALYFTNSYGFWRYNGIDEPEKVIQKTIICLPLIYNNLIYFIAENSMQLPELWSWDGINDPQLIEKFEQGHTFGIMPISMVVLINKLYIFLRTDSFEIEIWSYDGLNQPDFVCNFTEERDPSDLIVFNDKMFFYTTIPWPNDDGVIKLYIFDGFSSPMVFADVALNGFENPSALNYFTTYKRATVFNNSLIFVGNDDIHGDELWIYDGLNKPKLLADINPGQGNSHPCYFHEFDHKLYFSADDGIHGAELWVYEPDSIVDIIPDSIVNVNPEKLVKLNIYPNPAKQLINIQFANQNVKNQILVICDLSGKQILIQTIHSANQAIDISSLVRGYYIISIYSNTGTLIGSQPLIKY